MFKKTFLIFFITISLPSFILAAGYQPLVSDIPLKSAANSQSLQEFLKVVYNWGVFVAVGLAVLFIIFGGIQYMTTDSVFKKDEGRKRVVAAVAGLLIVLSSWLILNQINPRIFENSLNLGTLDKSKLNTSAITVGGVVVGGGGNNTQTGGNNTQNNGGQINTSGEGGQIVPIPNGITVKDGAGRNISSLISNKLVTLDNSLDGDGISWRVTEGYPPTRTHLSPCHANGTCVDTNFTNSRQATAANITNFINSANSAGLKAVYEVSSESEKQALISQGVPATNIITYSGITAPHFSVYNR